ncbi:MAG: hypothetical protein H6R19_868 [Proteobacteria bacterium]|nr:hypothetical protein [Pseudomonadota bacterium]
MSEAGPLLHEEPKSVQRHFIKATIQTQMPVTAVKKRKRGKDVA